MRVDKKLGGAGLRGQSAGETSLCTVGVSGTGLTYRGYDITDLAENTTFEEVAFLIFHGHLPNASELAGYKQKLKENRELPGALLEVLRGKDRRVRPRTSFCRIPPTPEPNR